MYERINVIAAINEMKVQDPEWIRDGHHMLEVYVPNTSINAWWDFE